MWLILMRLPGARLPPELTILEFCRQTQTRLIITTRVQRLPTDFARVEVHKLFPGDALELLKDAWLEGKEKSAHVSVGDDSAMAEIASLFDYLPLPLGWMGAAMRQTPELSASDLLTELRHKGVDELILTLREDGVTLGTPNIMKRWSVLDWIGRLSRRSKKMRMYLASWRSSLPTQKQWSFR